LVAVALLFLHTKWASRWIAAILAIFWTMTGVGYHWMFFSNINAAAYVFGTVFAVGGFMFFVEGTVRNRIQFKFLPDFRGWCALALIAYALLVYPLLGLLVTHPYPETPLFGVVPCPTTIFTLGLLILATHPRLILLGLAPVLWAGIGGTAAFLLEVPQDWALIVAGVVWLAFATHVGKHLADRTTGLGRKQKLPRKP